MLNKRTIIALLVLLLMLTGIGLLLLFGQTPRREEQKIVLAVSYDPSSAPIFVARERGFFRDEGIEATLEMHTTGKAALRSLLKGKAQLATVADTVLMFAAMDGRNIRCVASIVDSAKHHRVIALRNRGVAKDSDLRGKRIGVPSRTTGEFFLYTFLLFRGIGFKEVTLVDLQPEQMASALEQGQVDAVAAWSPMTTTLMKRFKQHAIEFSDENYLMSWNLVAPEELVRNDPDLVRRVLAAMLQAQRFMEKQPDAAISITSRFSRSDPAVLKRDWGDYLFGLRLGDALLIDLEDQARWALKLYYPERKKIPDFTQYIYAAGLRAVDPTAVGIRDERSP